MRAMTLVAMMRDPSGSRPISANLRVPSFEKGRLGGIYIKLLCHFVQKRNAFYINPPQYPFFKGGGCLGLALMGSRPYICTPRFVSALIKSFQDLSSANQ